MNILQTLKARLNLRAAPPKSAPAAPGFIVPAAAPRWLGQGVAQYTPQRVEQVYQLALSGDLQSQWEMFDLIEATSPRLAKNLNQLKDDAIALRLEVQPFRRKNAEPSPEAERRAEIVEEILWGMTPRPGYDENDFEDTQRDLMDARAKGVSVLEIDWELRQIATGQAWAPRATRWVHPSWYAFEGDRFRRRTGGQGGYQNAFTVTPNHNALVDFDPDKFIIGICKNKTGNPLGAAMLHTIAFWWAAANFTADAFFSFANVYGQPIRWATYDPNMTSGDQVKLKAMLENMGASAWGMFPEGATFELKEAAKGANDNPQRALIEMYDKLCDIVVLRQALANDVTAGASSSRAIGEVGERKEGNAAYCCAAWTAKTLQQLVRAICLRNFGNLVDCPFIAICDDEADDPKSLAEVLNTAKQAGLEPTDDELPEIGERLGFSVQRVAAPPPLGLFHPPVPGAQQKKAEDDDAGRGGGGVGHATEPAPDENNLQAKMADTLGVPAGWLNPVREYLANIEAKLADKSMSEADVQAFLTAALARLPELFNKMDKDELAKVFAQSMTTEAVKTALEK